MKNKALSIFIISGLMFVFLAQPTEAQAWFIKWGEYPQHENRHSKKEVRRHAKNDHKRQKKQRIKHYPENRRVFGQVVFGLPHGYITIRVGGENYRYHSGHYYRRQRHGYVVVPAPVGACIRSLPYGYQTVYMNGVTYYTYDDVYYKHTPRGFVVINRPRKHYPGHNGGSIYIAADIYDQLTINIPNEHGGYTPVRLQRTGDGFTGPQGEYYPDFPKVAQLKVIYGY